MVGNSAYRVHGIWSKLMLEFIKDKNPFDCVSFSDNRLFDGGVYEKIGFMHDGDIGADYYWTKDRKKHHKSGLRKQKHEMASGLTETILRENQGYKRVFDLGKKRWLWTMADHLDKK
jgi:hypothetical protein